MANVAVTIVSLVTIYISHVATLQCQPGEFPTYIVAGNVELDLSGVSGAATPITINDLQDAVACQQRCDGLTTFICTSITYSPVRVECILYPLKSTDEGVITVPKSDVFHYTGICGETPNLDNCTDTNVQVDLAFIVDGSGSICDDDPTVEPDRSSCQNWRSLLNFMQRVINVLPVSADTTRVALVSFANGGKVEFNLERYSTKTEIEIAINNLMYPDGNTNTYEALSLMRTSIFNGSNDDRPESRDVALVITDGFPTSNVNQTELKALAAQADDIIMFAVGITEKIDESWLKVFSSEPKELGRNYFRTPDFNSLNPIISSLLSAACLRLDPLLVPTTTTTTTPVAQSSTTSSATETGPTRDGPQAGSQGVDIATIVTAVVTVVVSAITAIVIAVLVLRHRKAQHARNDAHDKELHTYENQSVSSTGQHQTPNQTSDPVEYEEVPAPVESQYQGMDATTRERPTSDDAYTRIPGVGVEEAVRVEEQYQEVDVTSREPPRGIDDYDKIQMGA